MTPEFQKSLIRCLFQLPDLMGKIPLVPSKVFDLVEEQFLMELLTDYVRDTHTLPSKAEIAEYYAARIRQKNVPDDVSRRIIQAIHSVYLPIDGEMEYVRRVLNGEVLRKQVKGQMQELATALQDTPSDQVLEVVERTFMGMARAIREGKPQEEETYQSAGFISETYVRSEEKGHPTIFKSLNKMMSAGGFKTPELILLLSAPKNFKTGTMIELALGFMRDGLKVYYADTENGAESIRERVEQHMMKATYEEMHNPEIYDKISEVREWYTKLGGDMVIDSYTAYRSTPGDVWARLSQLRLETGFIPDMIVWDSIDHFVPTLLEDKKKDERLKIKAVFFEVIAINKKCRCFSLAPSQVNRAAVDKKVFSMKDFSEDFSKSFNCHAAFALCRTPEEVEAGIGRLIVVVQRRGERYRPNSVCVVEIDESIGSVKEISLEDAMDRLGEPL